jgi:hypothetical protein
MQGQPDIENGEQRMVYSSSILFEKQPIEAMEALLIRRQQAKTINKDLADWLTSYGRLRLHYVDELKKIHKKGELLFSDESDSNLQNSKLSALGLCSPMWSDILKNLDNEITLFDQSTRKMGRDMIAPLRLFTRNNDSNLVEMDQLIEIATDLRNANKDGQSTALLDDEWARRAPYFFEIFENYDYERLTLLKDVFLKYQTDVGDVISKFKKDNENGLEHVLNFNVDDEISRFSQDVIATNLPIENIKLDNVQNSRISTNGFTAAAAAAANTAGVAGAAIGTNAANNSKRHSTLLSPHRFHLKKNSDHDNSSSNISTPNNGSSSAVNKRLSSNNSVFSSATSASATDKRKDKHSVRSKFGSIFKGRKKGGKDSMYAPPSTIHEPDNSSINTETTTNSLRMPNQRQRNQSVISNTTPSQDSMRYANPVEDNYQSRPPETVQKQKQSTPEGIQNQHAIRNSMASIDNYVEDKALPSYPLAAEQAVVQQQHFAEKKSETSLYEPMRPTKRSDSIPSLTVPQVSSNVIMGTVAAAAVGAAITGTIASSTSIDASNSIISPPPSATTGATSLAQASRGMDNIPEAASVINNSILQPPPPPSRKHVSTNESIISSNARQPHGSAPIPPSQRKSVLLDQQQPLQPASTGAQQNETTSTTLAKNTTGGGSLVGGQIMHPSLTTPGLNTSIVELFNATFKDGILSRSNAIGEVAFSFIVGEDKKLPSEISLQILSKKDLPLPNFMVNTMFLQQLSTPGFFTISDPSQISMRTVGGLKYMLNNPTPPIVITPIWKHENNQSTVIISVKPTNELESFLSNETLSLSNFMISVSIQGALVSSAATKPSGSLNKEKGRVTWISPTPVTFNASKKEERFVARFMTNQLASESETGVQVRFNISNDDGAGRIDFLNTDLEIKARGENLVEDPFGDGVNKEVDDWSDVPTLKSLVAGSYSGHS